LNNGNIKQIMDSDGELYLFFINEERNKDLENRFFEYINHYSNLNKKDKSDTNDNNNYNKVDKIKSKVIKFAFANI